MLSDVGGVVVARQPSLGGLPTAVAGRLLEPELIALSSHGGHHLFINRIPPRLPKEDVEKIILAQLRLHPFVLQVSRCSVIPQNSLKNKGYGFITLDGSPSASDLDAIADSLNNKLQVGCRTLGVRVCTDCHSACYAEEDGTASSSSHSSTPPNEPGNCDPSETHAQALVGIQLHANCLPRSPISATDSDTAAGVEEAPAAPPLPPTGALAPQPDILQTAVAVLAKQGLPVTVLGGPQRRKVGSHHHAYAEHGQCIQHHQHSHTYQPHGFLGTARGRQVGKGQSGHGAVHAASQPKRRVSDVSPVVVSIELDERSRSAEPQLEPQLGSQDTPLTDRGPSPARSHDELQLQPSPPSQTPTGDHSEATLLKAKQQRQQQADDQQQQLTGCSVAAGAGGSPRSVSSYGSSSGSAACSAPHSAPGSVSGSGSARESAVGGLGSGEYVSEPRVAAIAAATAAPLPESVNVGGSAVEPDAGSTDAQNCLMVPMRGSCYHLSAEVAAASSSSPQPQGTGACLVLTAQQQQQDPVAVTSAQDSDETVVVRAPHSQQQGVRPILASHAEQAPVLQSPPPQQQLQPSQQQQQHDSKGGPPLATASSSAQFGRVRQSQTHAKQPPTNPAVPAARCSLRLPTHGSRHGSTAPPGPANVHSRAGRGAHTAAAARGVSPAMMSGPRQAAGWKPSVSPDYGSTQSQTQIHSASAPSSSSWYLHQFYKRQLHEQPRIPNQARHRPVQAGTQVVASVRGHVPGSTCGPLDGVTGSTSAMTKGAQSASGGGDHDGGFTFANRTSGGSQPAQKSPQQASVDMMFQGFPRQAWVDRTEGGGGADGLGTIADRRGSYPGGSSVSARAHPQVGPQQSQPRQSQQSQLQVQLQHQFRPASYPMSMAVTNGVQSAPPVGLHPQQPSQQQQQPSVLRMQRTQQQQQPQGVMYFQQQQQPGLQQQHLPQQTQQLPRCQQDSTYALPPEQHPQLQPERQRGSHGMEQPHLGYFVAQNPHQQQQQFSCTLAPPQPQQQPQPPPVSHQGAFGSVCGVGAAIGGHPGPQQTGVVSSHGLPSSSPPPVGPTLSLQLLMGSSGPISDGFRVGSPAPHGASAPPGLVGWRPGSLDLAFLTRPDVVDLQQQQRQKQLPVPGQALGSGLNAGALSARSTELLLGPGSSDGVEDPGADSAESTDLNPLDFEPMILQLLENEDDDGGAHMAAARRYGSADPKNQQRQQASVPSLFEQHHQQQMEAFVMGPGNQPLSLSSAGSAGQRTLPPGVGEAGAAPTFDRCAPSPAQQQQQQLHAQQRPSGGPVGVAGNGRLPAGIGAGPSWDAPGPLGEGGSGSTASAAASAASFASLPLAFAASSGLVQAQGATRSQQPQHTQPLSSVGFGMGPSPAAACPVSAPWPRGRGPGGRGRGAAMAGSFPGPSAGAVTLAAAGTQRRGGAGGGGRGTGGGPGASGGGFRGGRHYGGRGPPGVGGYSGGRGPGPKAGLAGGGAGRYFNANATPARPGGGAAGGGDGRVAGEPEATGSASGSLPSTAGLQGMAQGRADT